MVSAYGEEKMWGEALGSGAQDYILKPFKAEDIVKAVKKILSGERAKIQFGTSGLAVVIMAEEFTFENVRKVVQAIADHVRPRHSSTMTWSTRHRRIWTAVSGARSSRRRRRIYWRRTASTS